MTMQVTAYGNRVASLGQKVTVTIDPDQRTVDLRAPFYRRSIPLRDIASVGVAPDDGMNHGFLNWFVFGRENSPRGVRLNTGGKARIDITTTTGGRFGVVVDTIQQAQTVADAIKTS